MKKPYKLVRIKENKYLVYIPKWVPNLQIGWRIDEGIDDEFFTYEVNRYSSWLGDVPAEIMDKLDLAPKIEAKVKDGKVTFNRQEKAQEIFKNHITKWGEKEADIKPGHEFDIILKIIESGGIPYEKQPVDLEDFREPDVKYTLYDYQKKAVDLFKKTGAVGVYYPTGGRKDDGCNASNGLTPGPEDHSHNKDVS